MSKCEAILELHRTGRSNPEILKLTKAPKSIISDTVNHYLKLGTSEDHPRCGRPVITQLRISGPSEKG